MALINENELLRIADINISENHIDRFSDISKIFKYYLVSLKDSILMGEYKLYPK